MYCKDLPRRRYIDYRILFVDCLFCFFCNDDLPEFRLMLHAGHQRQDAVAFVQLFANRVSVDTVDISDELIEESGIGVARIVLVHVSSQDVEFIVVFNVDREDVCDHILPDLVVQEFTS